jgi:hypothetical protein
MVPSEPGKGQRLVVELWFDVE